MTRIVSLLPAATGVERRARAGSQFDLRRSELEAERLTLLPGWRQLPAVAQKNASVIDGDAYLNRPGPRLVESLELLHALISRAGRPHGPHSRPIG